MSKFARIAHWITLALMAAVVLAATGDGFAQSWAGLYGWAIEHGLHGWKAMAFPGLVDAFILVGELGLFALALEGHRVTRASKLSWVDLAVAGGSAVAGWAVSLGFNIGHVDQEFTDQLTAGVPPIASMLGLLILLRTLHRLVTRQATTPAGVVEGVVGVVADEADDQLAAAVNEAFLDQRGEDVAAMLARVAGLRESVAQVVGTVAAADSEDDTDPVESDHESDHPDEGATAGQRPVFDLVTAIKAASAAGQSQRRIARSFKVHRSRVKRILDGGSDPDPELAAATHTDH